MIGVTVLVLAVLAAAVIPVLTGRGIGGTAIRSGEPIPGDCVHVSTNDPEGAAADGLGSGLPMAVVVPCGEPDVTSVIARVPDAAAPSAISPEAGAGLAGVCEESAAALVRRWQGGLFRRSGDGIDVEVRAVLPLSGGSAGPAEDAVGRGESWGICYAVGRTVAGDPVLTVLPADGPPPAAGLCFTATGGELESDAPEPGESESYGAASSCGMPHRTQILGTVVSMTSDGSATGSDGAPARLPGLCREYLQQAIARTDPTDSGALTVIAASRGGSGGWCGLRSADPQRTLSGSLLGIGAGPLPWT